MKQKRTILTILLLMATVMVTRPVISNVWRHFAYEQRNLPGSEWVCYLKKKAAWLPGRDTVVLAIQSCPRCSAGEHERCSEVLSKGASVTTHPDGSYAIILELANGDSVAMDSATRLCLCSDPSHNRNR